MSAHPLDRPAAHALATRQAHLAIGDARAHRFDPDYALFAAWQDERALAALVALGETVAAVEAEPLPAPPGFTAAPAACVQMTAAAIHGPDRAVEPLEDADAGQMRVLAALTEPGPFFTRTHHLGRFVGVKVDGRLIAMAGERMHLPGHREVSAVCTHPDHRGQGHAAALTRFVARRMLAEGDMPFLQAYADNAAAIALYEALGFRVRREVSFTTMRRK